MSLFDKHTTMRIKIDIPDRAHNFHTAFTLTVGDLNYGNHLGNDRLLMLAHEARMRFFSDLGHTELNFFGKGLIMVDSAVQYQAQGHWGDVIDATLWLEPFRSTGFSLFYKFKKGETPLATVKTGMAFFDYDSSKVVAAPHDFTKSFSL